jgi:uncharacterized protein involved in oxidation of intracellular sulfur
MKTVFVLNDPPYGTECCYNARAGQMTPDGYYNIERMLKRLVIGGGHILLCSTCMSARGLGDAEVIAGARPSTMDDLAAATIYADKVLVF